MVAIQTYEILKFLHVLLAIVAVGFNATYAVWLARAAKEPEHEAFALRGVKFLDDRIANPAYALLLYARRRLPKVAAGHIAAGRCDAVMCHFKLVTPPLLDAVREAGGELYVWTVDDARRIRSLEAMGVTGVITNDPRLFDDGAQAMEQLAAE